MQTAKTRSGSPDRNVDALASHRPQPNLQPPPKTSFMLRTSSPIDLRLQPGRPRPSLADAPCTPCALPIQPALHATAPAEVRWPPPVPALNLANSNPMAGPGRRRLGIAQMRAVPLLATLGDAQLGPLAEQASVETYRRGALVVEQGQATLALYALLDGSARATRLGDNGRTLVVDVMQRGDSFGELGVIDGLPHRATVRAVRPCEILVLPISALTHCLAQSAALRDALMRTLVTRLRKANQRITMLALNDVRGCVIQHLLDSAETHGGQRLVPGPLRRQGIADTIGASRERVSRVILDLVRSGAIKMLPDGRARIDGLALA